MSTTLTLLELTPAQVIEVSDPALRISNLNNDQTLEIDMPIVNKRTETETWEMTLGLRVSGQSLNLTGYTLTDIYVTGADGMPVNTSGKIRIISPSQGTVGYKPAAGDLVASKSPYRIRVAITENSSGLVRFFPNREADEIVVHPLR